MTGANKKAGRPKGAINKKTKLVRDKFEEAGIDPIIEICNLAATAKSEGDDKFAFICYKELLPYYAPRLTATKVEATITEKTHEERLSELFGNE